LVVKFPGFFVEGKKYTRRYLSGRRKPGRKLHKKIPVRKEEARKESTQEELSGRRQPGRKLPRKNYQERGNQEGSLPGRIVRKEAARKEAAQEELSGRRQPGRKFPRKKPLGRR
jgi:hypothetical protein